MAHPQPTHRCPLIAHASTAGLKAIQRILVFLCVGRSYRQLHQNKKTPACVLHSIITIRLFIYPGKNVTLHPPLWSNEVVVEKVEGFPYLTGTGWVADVSVQISRAGFICSLLRGCYSTCSSKSSLPRQCPLFSYACEMWTALKEHLWRLETFRLAMPAIHPGFDQTGLCEELTNHCNV